MKENNAFVVSNRTMATSILCLTGIKFKPFKNKDGDDRYSFPREEIVFEAYNYIQDFRNNKKTIY